MICNLKPIHNSLEGLEANILVLNNSQFLKGLEVNILVINTQFLKRKQRLFWFMLAITLYRNKKNVWKNPESALIFRIFFSILYFILLFWGVAFW